MRLLRSVGDQFYNALTLVDLRGPDQPLIYVNRAFSSLTGYPQDEILGRNCRFLQGPKTSAEDVSRVRAAIAHRRAVFCDLLNYRKDGTTFYNRLVLLPLEVADHPHFIGMQIDASPLLAQPMAEGAQFDDLKTSDEIRDRINAPLTNIFMSFAIDDVAGFRPGILERAFTQILTTVKALPFRHG